MNNVVKLNIECPSATVREAVAERISQRCGLPIIDDHDVPFSKRSGDEYTAKFFLQENVVFNGSFIADYVYDILDKGKSDPAEKVQLENIAGDANERGVQTIILNINSFSDYMRAETPQIAGLIMTMRPFYKDAAESLSKYGVLMMETDGLSIDQIVDRIESFYPALELKEAERNDDFER